MSGSVAFQGGTRMAGRGTHGCRYAVAAPYGLVPVSLDDIREELEDPLDAFGIDVIRLADAEYFDGVLREPTAA